MLCDDVSESLGDKNLQEPLLLSNPKKRNENINIEKTRTQPCGPNPHVFYLQKSKLSLTP